MEEELIETEEDFEQFEEEVLSEEVQAVEWGPNDLRVVSPDKPLSASYLRRISQLILPVKFQRLVAGPFPKSYAEDWGFRIFCSSSDVFSVVVNITQHPAEDGGTVYSVTSMSSGDEDWGRYTVMGSCMNSGLLRLALDLIFQQEEKKKALPFALFPEEL